MSKDKAERQEGEARIGHPPTHTPILRKVHPTCSHGYLGNTL